MMGLHRDEGNTMNDIETGNHRFRVWDSDESLELSWNHGGPSLFGTPDTHTCAACRHTTGLTWGADGTTHRVNRSGEPSTVQVGLCAHCWGELLRDCN